VPCLPVAGRAFSLATIMLLLAYSIGQITTTTRKIQMNRTERQKAALRRGVKCDDNTMMKLIKVDKLSVDSGYQRPFVPASINKIKAHFDPKAVGVLQVCQRRGSGSLKIVDGQNRHRAIEELLAEPDCAAHVPKELLCLVRLNTTRKEEAKMFVQHNTCRAVAGNDRFRASLKFDSEKETAIENMVKQAGFVISFLPRGRIHDCHKTGNGIRSVSGLERCYKRCPDHLLLALKFLRRLYNDNPKQVPYSLREGRVVQAIGTFLQGQHITSVQQLRPYINMIRDRNIDLVAIWEDIKSGSTPPRILFEWLRDSIGNGGALLRAAA